MVDFLIPRMTCLTLLKESHLFFERIPMRCFELYVKLSNFVTGFFWFLMYDDVGPWVAILRWKHPNTNG